MMSTARLRELYKQEQNHRKFACVRNEMVKTRQDQFESYIDREKQESVQKNDKAIVFTRKHVVRQHVLTRCMKNKREEIERKAASDLYGKYNGVGLEEIAGGIDNYIEKNHPRIRRKKKIEELFNKGYRKGEIIDNSTMHTKVEQYFEKPLVEVHVDTEMDIAGRQPTMKQQTKPFLPAISNGFYTGTIQSVKFSDTTADTAEHTGHAANQSIKDKVSKYLSEDVPDDVSMHSEVGGFPKTTASKAIRPITLPPIKMGTDNSTADGKPRPRPATDSIADIISRINYAKERRQKEAKIKKEKRQRRILAEKVHGVNQGDVPSTTGSSVADESEGDQREQNYEAVSKTVLSNRGVGFLNLTVPVLSKSKKDKAKRQISYKHPRHDAGGDMTKTTHNKHSKRREGAGEVTVTTVSDDNKSKQDTDVKKRSEIRDGKPEARFNLPPLPPKGRSIDGKE